MPVSIETIVKAFPKRSKGILERIRSISTYEEMERLKRDLASGDDIAKYHLKNTDWGAIEKQILSTSVGRAEKLEKDLLDPKSAYYTKFADQLRKQFGDMVSPDSMLAMKIASGGDYGSSQVIANKQAEAARNRIGSAVTDATQQQWMQNTGQATGLMGMAQQNQQFWADFKEKTRQFNESQPSFGDNLLNIGSGLLGNFLGGGGLTSIFQGGRKATGATPINSYPRPYGSV